MYWDAYFLWIKGGQCMKTFVRYTVMVLSIAAACQAGLAFAEDYYWANGGDQTNATTTALEKTAPAQPQSWN